MLFECEQPFVDREALRDGTKNGCEETNIICGIKISSQSNSYHFLFHD